MNKIQTMSTDTGVSFDVTGLSHIGLSSKGNVEISTEAGQKLNIETGDNIALKPNGNLQFDNDHYANTADKDEFKLKAICADKDKVVGFNVEAGGLKFLTKAASALFGWNPDEFKLKFQKTKDTWAKLKLSAASIDLRGRSTGPGTGGGIAVQIASTDSHGKENKFKIETDRKVDVDATASASDYNGEGGMGIEIGTINSQYTSLYTKEYRFKGNAPIFGVTRGSVEETETGKWDYPTQEDDSKDIKNDDSPVTWNDVIAAVKYLKGQNLI